MTRETLSLRDLVALAHDTESLKIGDFLKHKQHVIGFQRDSRTDWLVTVRCIVCWRIEYLELKHEDLLAWASGTFAQHVWPDENLREQMMSGMHGDCFDSVPFP